MVYSELWSIPSGMLCPILCFFGADAKCKPSLFRQRLTAAAIRKTVIGNRDPKYVATSLLDWQNHAMRMTKRRFTRLTNGSAKGCRPTHT